MPSARRATGILVHRPLLHQISIHALREEGDRSSPRFPRYLPTFLSTPSARRATLPLPSPCRRWFYFYPRPPRGGRLIDPARCPHTYRISIHALREEGDPLNGAQLLAAIDISIHALREEGDSSRSASLRRCLEFLSTPSARRATVAARKDEITRLQFLSTPSARRAT